MQPPVRFRIEDEPLYDMTVRPAAGSDDVLVLVDARVARTSPNLAGPRRLVLAIAMVVIGAAVTTLMVVAPSARPPHPDVTPPVLAPTTDGPALVVGASRPSSADASARPANRTHVRSR